MMKRINSLALPFLLGLSLTFACTAAFGVEHPDGTFATPDYGDSSDISFKHINNTNVGDYPYGFFSLGAEVCDVDARTDCVTNCIEPEVIELGAATLTSIPDSDIAVSELVFNTVGVDLIDTTSAFCAVLDGAGNVWAIDRDLPNVSNITTANSWSRIIPCKTTDIFSPVNGCPKPARPMTTLFSVKGGYIKMDTTDGNAPSDAECSETAHNGRMVVDDVNNLLYICTASGWKNTQLID